MNSLLGGKRAGPIGIDIGSRSLKLLQLSADRTTVLQAARYDLPAEDGLQQRWRQASETLRRAQQERGFHGRAAVLCLGSEALSVQNLRVPPVAGAELRKVVEHEVAGRLPFDLKEAEMRFLEAGDVRQGDVVRREVIAMACHRPVLEELIRMAEAARLTPVAIDAEPAALLRGYARQFRRSDDQQSRIAFVHVGAASTVVVVGCGAQALFVKYLESSGNSFDQAVADHLELPLPDAAALRRRTGDRRADQRDPEVTRTLLEALRPAYERLSSELAMCLRYYSVTFRGQPLARLVLGGGEASEGLLEWLAARVDLPCELGDPMRAFEAAPTALRSGQFDVAAGLALKEITC
ncbi:MAG: pilus assembly protein PilM [Planctomycetota bacterium]